ncbi:GNAT family N-acetyltransferase [Piscinibacter sp. XHJ-5]|uniref:GNAT family N-acetyltransferase n=1 Tax=Piscinibacter sp. XHJ-5 TaxID=3037797 RepID=UPI0024529166|nr:GNAT family N-acetyltransferase [Piscinibacter sp. XHJ-5]
MHEETGANDYVIRVLDDLSAIEPPRWNALLDTQTEATPFLRHEYLSALHESGSAASGTGWWPQFLIVERGAELVAACPLYLKDHSYGEYVFDWAWADAYHRHGLRYYPKLLSSIPYTPVPGARLLARDARSRELLLQAMTQMARDAELSSAHVLFLSEADRAAAAGAGWMMRSTVQFHWTNREPEPYRDFADLLQTLQREKRKKIQQERRRVAEAGIGFTVLQGSEIGERDWDFFYRCYTLTYRAHHSTPYLTREFFQRMARTMPDHWLLFVAWKNGRRVGASLIALDRARGAAFGRYWGAVEHIPFLHFEACYYQPLAWCIAQRMRRFEGGAQGEHKMARGLLPVQTWSAHWLAHPQFAAAVADFLEREGAGVAQYLDELNERHPFKASASPQA